MTCRHMIAATAGMVLLGSAVARADSYQPGDYLTLDVPHAVLSPRPLGPPAVFEQVQIEARTDIKAQPAPPPAAARAVPVARAPRQALAKPRPPARARVVRSHSNPLDANAADTRIQVWPCRTGGICNWQR